jgi:hypothetical protein
VVRVVQELIHQNENHSHKIIFLILYFLTIFRKISVN